MLDRKSRNWTEPYLDAYLSVTKSIVCLLQRWTNLLKIARSLSAILSRKNIEYFFYVRKVPHINPVKKAVLTLCMYLLRWMFYKQFKFFQNVRKHVKRHQYGQGAYITGVEARSFVSNKIFDNVQIALSTSFFCYIRSNSSRTQTRNTVKLSQRK